LIDDAFEGLTKAKDVEERICDFGRTFNTWIVVQQFVQAKASRGRKMKQAVGPLIELLTVKA
jgi:hypothetical protein